MTGEDFLSGRDGPGPQGLSKLRSPKRRAVSFVLQAGLAPGHRRRPSGGPACPLTPAGLGCWEPLPTWHHQATSGDTEMFCFNCWVF